MAKPTEDVIELGSSDEESRPAPKKKAANVGCKLNAMVHIPPGVSIKSSSKSASINPIKKLIGKGLTVTKVKSKTPASKTPIPVLTKQPVKVVHNGKSPVRYPVHNQPNRASYCINPMNKNIQVRPASNMVRINTPNLLNLPNTTNKQLRFPVQVKPPPQIAPVINKNVRIPIPNANLRSNVTPKRMTPCTATNASKKRKLTASSEVMTVNLDDDEAPAPSPAGPQWYLRPEESHENKPTSDPLQEKEEATENVDVEKKNNDEPTKFIEITIEDSPIKPVQNKRTHVIGAELAITIDDSPVKASATKEAPLHESDDENDQTDKPPKNSKKRLNYPQKSVEQNTIEIEIEPMQTDTMSLNEECQREGNDHSSANNEKEIAVPDNCVIEIMESPAKVEAIAPGTPKKNENHVKVIPTQISSELKEPGEFNNVYQEFIDLCLSLEDSNDMKTIVEKKIKNYYRQVPKEYTESEEFLELVQSKILAMRAGPEKLYLYIKDIVDELNLQRKMAKAKPTETEIRVLEAEKFQYGEESEFDSKRQRQIRKLEKTLKKLHRAIQKLEEQEVDFDDEEDSVYLLTERYKERMVRVHAKFCQLTNTKMPSEPRIQIDPRPGQPAGPAKRLEKWVNKKVPIGMPLPFPDFHDVLRCVREANDEDRLGWNEADIMEEARDLFTRCGKKLQRRRQENEWRLAASRISLEVDPAEKSEELKKKLDTNKQLASMKETEVLKKYADKQSQLKLEAEEIGDKEADESPAEEDEEVEVPEDSNMENKEKRKERLRRLLKEKSKKTNSVAETKENSDENKDNSDVAKLSTETELSEENKKSVEIGDTAGKTMEVNAVSRDINDVMEVDDSSQESKECKEKSDSDNKVDSDVDELHLLQKLHSDGVNTSTANTTDSESAIDISDTLSSSDNKKINSDVISIENSSYSESEIKEDNTKNDNPNIDENDMQDQRDSKIVKLDNNSQISLEIECASNGIKINRTNNDEYNESVESILLGSSDDEGEDNKDDSPKSNSQCVNLKDDAISIGETVIQEGNIVKSKALGDVSEITSEFITEINVPDTEKRKFVESEETLQEDKICSTIEESKEIDLNKNSDETSNCLAKSNDETGAEVNNIEIVLEPVTSEESKSPPAVDEESTSSHANVDITENPQDSSTDTLLPEAKCITMTHSIVLETDESSKVEKDESSIEKDDSSKVESGITNDQESVKQDEPHPDNKLEESNELKVAENTNNSSEHDLNNVTNVSDSDVVENLQHMIEDLQADIITSSGK